MGLMTLKIIVTADSDIDLEAIEDNIRSFPKVLRVVSLAILEGFGTKAELDKMTDKAKTLTARTSEERL